MSERERTEDKRERQFPTSHPGRTFISALAVTKKQPPGNTPRSTCDRSASQSARAPGSRGHGQSGVDDLTLERGVRDPATNVSDDDEITTGKIALAHLNEFPDYYRRLAEWRPRPSATGRRATRTRRLTAAGPTAFGLDVESPVRPDLAAGGGSLDTFRSPPCALDMRQAN